MGTMSHLTLVVPLFDEEERLAERGDDLLEWAAAHPGGADLVLVDDGSTDGTVAVAASLVERARSAGGPAVRVVRRPHRGKGAAVTAGLAGVRTPFAGFCDVDLSTPLDQFDLVVKAAEREAGLAIASRDAPGAELVRRQSIGREWLGRQYNRLLRMTLVPGINDTQCGAKAAPSALWHEVLAHCGEDGLAWDVEVILTARRLGRAVVEVPVSWSHDGRSRVRLVSDGTALLTALPRIAVRSRRVACSAPAPAAGVFDADRARTLLDHADHWWFRAKADAVSDLLDRHPPDRDGVLVDLGAGAGTVTARLAWTGDRVAVDGNRSLAAAARGRGLGALVADTARTSVAPGSADVVCLLDVIEHSAEPVALLREARRLVDPGGRVVVSVPAHDWLWSRADVLLGHHRRYTRRLLREQLASSGLEPLTVRHAFSWLVPPAWLVRRVVRPGGDAQLGLGADGPVIARVAAALAWLERRAPALPFGTTVLAVAQVAAPADQLVHPEVLGVPATR